MRRRRAIGLVDANPGAQTLKLCSAHLRNLRRFTDLSITVPPGARLVVLAGPNGTGKSTVFDAFRVWQGRWVGYNHDPIYYDKTPNEQAAPPDRVQLSFDRPVESPDDGRSAFYIRTAYRHEPDFANIGMAALTPLKDLPRPTKMLDQESGVSDNYRQLVGQSLAAMYDTANDNVPTRDLRETLIGELRESMRRVFPDLVVDSIVDPLASGSFYFSKGSVRHWHYKNLSGGEKAAFDLLLDMLVKRPAFVDTVYCIDEPETHLNSRVQGALLNELLNLLPADGQLWIASHSIGMMRAALDRWETAGGVAFLDFADRDFDDAVALGPVTPNRSVWRRWLNVALDDVAELVAPREVVLVEGRPVESGKGNAEFDARCLRRIFSDNRVDTEFISVGNSADVANDRLGTAGTVLTLTPGARVIRVVDRDDRSAEEVAALSTRGVRVLSERHLESFLLSDEMIGKLCDSVHQPTAAPGLIAEKAKMLTTALANGHPPDDVKAIAGVFYNAARSRLGLVQAGSTSNEFLSDCLAPLVTPDTDTFRRLEHDIFGPPL